MANNIYPKKGKPLTKEGLFMLICEEVYKDGVVEDWEEKIVRTMSAALKLTPEQSQKIVKAAIERYMDDKLGSERPLSPPILYKKALYYCMADNSVDHLEKAMILSLRKLFSVSDKDHKQILLNLGVKIDPFFDN